MSRNDLRLKTVDVPITSERAAFVLPAPSCLGGAHRRCLLDAESCSCPCHLGAEMPQFERVIEFRCPICRDPFATTEARLEHFEDAHVIARDAPEEDRMRFERTRNCVCDGCGYGFRSWAGLRSHQVQKRCGSFGRRDQ